MSEETLDELPKGTTVIGGTASLSIRDVMEMFDVSEMTIASWRKKLDFPTIILPGKKRHTVRFVKSEVIVWAAQHDKSVVKLP